MDGLPNDENALKTPKTKVAKRLSAVSPFSSITPTHRRPLKQNRQALEGDCHLDATYLETTIHETTIGQTAATDTSFDGPSSSDVTLGPKMMAPLGADPNLEMTLADFDQTMDMFNKGGTTTAVEVHHLAEQGGDMDITVGNQTARGDELDQVEEQEEQNTTIGDGAVSTKEESILDESKKTAESGDLGEEDKNVTAQYDSGELEAQTTTAEDVSVAVEEIENLDTATNDSDSVEPVNNDNQDQVQSVKGKDQVENESAVAEDITIAVEESEKSDNNLTTEQASNVSESATMASESLGTVPEITSTTDQIDETKPNVEESIATELVESEAACLETSVVTAVESVSPTPEELEQSTAMAGLSLADELGNLSAPAAVFNEAPTALSSLADELSGLDTAHSAQDVSAGTDLSKPVPEGTSEVHEQPMDAENVSTEPTAIVTSLADELSGVEAVTAQELSCHETIEEEAQDSSPVETSPAEAVADVVEPMEEVSSSKSPDAVLAECEQEDEVPPLPVSQKKKKKNKSAVHISPILRDGEDADFSLLESPQQPHRAQKYSDSMIEYLEIENRVMLDMTLVGKGEEDPKHADNLARISTLETQLQTALAELDQLKEEKQTMTTSAEANVVALKLELAQAVEEVSAARSREQQLQEQLTSAETARDVAQRDKVDFEFMHEMSRKKLEEVRKTTSLQIIALEEEAAAARKREEGKSPMLAGLHAEVARLNAQVDDLNAEKRGLVQERDDACSKMNSVSTIASQEISSLKQSLAMLTQEVGQNESISSELEDLRSRLTQHVEKERQLEQELSTLRSNLESAQTESSKLREEHSKATAELETERTEKNRLDEELVSLKAQLSEAVEGLAAANDRLTSFEKESDAAKKSLDDQLSTLRTELEAAQSELVRSREERDVAVAGLEKESETRKTVEIELSSAQDQLSEVSTTLSATSDRLSALQQEAADTKKKLEDELALSIEKLALSEKAVKELEVAVEQNGVKTSEMVESSRQQVEALNLEISSLKQKSDDVTSQLEKALKQNDDHMAELEDLRSRVSSSEAEAAAVKTTHEDLTRRLAEVTAEKEKTDSQLQECRVELESHSTKMTTLASERDSLQAEKVVAETTNKDLLAQLTSLQSAVSSSSQSAKEAQEKLAELASEMSLLAKSERNKQAEITRLNSLIETAETEFSEKLKADVAAARTAAAAGLAEARRETNELRTRLQEAEAKSSVAEQQSEERAAEAEKLRLELAAKMDQATEVDAVRAELQLRKDALESALSSVGQLSAEADALRLAATRTTELEAQMAVVDVDVAKVKAERDAAVSECALAKKESANLRSTITLGMAELEKNKTEVSSLSGQLSSLTDQVTALKRELDESRAAQDKKEKEVTSLTEKVHTMSEEMAVQKRDLDRLEEECDEFDELESTYKQRIGALSDELNELKGNKDRKQPAGLLAALKKDVAPMSPQSSLLAASSPVPRPESAEDQAYFSPATSPKMQRGDSSMTSPVNPDESMTVGGGNATLSTTLHTTRRQPKSPGESPSSKAANNSRCAQQ